MPCTTVRITDVDLLCLIHTRATALITRGYLTALQLSCALLLCQHDSGLTSAQNERLAPILLVAKRAEA